MALHQDEWLHLAKRQPLNGTGRHNHLRERRPNLAVGNTSDRYWAYCNACKQGAVLMKEHVVITGKPAPAASCDMTLPFDMVKLVDAEKAVQDGVLGFLAHKNMDAQYLPELWFSKTRMRIIFQWGGKWYGRDTTERSPQKWLTFNGSSHMEPPLSWDGHAVIVEDAFSFFKVRWATRTDAVDVFCSLGTTISDSLMVRLLEYNKVGMYYDGDVAGHKGAWRESHRLRSMGMSAYCMCAPAGFDPKDQSITEIRRHVM